MCAPVNEELTAVKKRSLHWMGRMTAKKEYTVNKLRARKSEKSRTTAEDNIWSTLSASNALPINESVRCEKVVVVSHLQEEECAYTRD